MAQWRLQDPGNFSPAFHAAIALGTGTHVVARTSTRQAAKGLQNKWNLFRFCCRGYAGTTVWAQELAFERKTFVRYSDEEARWQLCVTVKETSVSILKSIKVVTKTD